MTEDGRLTREIRRIQIAKTAYMDMTSLFRSIKIKFSLRMRALTTFILSILLYGCESWTLNQDSRNKLAAAEMWFLRRVLRILWTARRTNQEVLQLAKV